mgnify:CR=1 FL=1
MHFKRSSQVAEVIKREMSDILSHHIKDPRLGFITVTGVDLSDDLRYAKVFVSIFGEKDKQQESLDGLASAKGFIRKEIGSRLRLRYCPDFSFKVDESIAYGDKIDRLLNQISKEDKPDDSQ